MFDPDYELFVEIIAAGSISAAARARRLSTAACSKRLARLEARLGARLVHRTTRRLALTAAGQDLHDALLPLRAGLRAAEERIAGRASQVAGLLRITAPTSFGRIHVVPCLPGFLDRHPAVDLRIDLSDAFVDLLGAPYDLAVRIAAGIGPGLVGQRLGTSPRVLCAAPAYLAASGEPATLAELAGHRLLAADNQLPWQLDGPDGTVAYHGTSAVRTNSSEVVRELALGGGGIALRSLWDVAPSLRSGALRRILPAYQGSGDVGIFAVHGPSPVIAAPVRAFIAHLAAALPRFDPGDGVPDPASAH